MHSNRLSLEKSPYLLQHAHNPVDWYAWGEEAFAKSLQENKPIFLSIGYSTCHWCHVMERESFENQEIADIMNAHFVCIKVDREEHPDVDKIYMLALTQVMKQHGGWPLSMWLTPKLQPFFGGTYFHPDSGLGRPGFRSLLRQIAQLWITQKNEIELNSQQVTEMLQKIGTTETPGEFSVGDIEQSIQEFTKNFDITNGGFGSAPKFPQPSYLAFLLRHSYRTGHLAGLEMCERQLYAMANGGIYDHLAGGFARYSTDKMWLVPHFEKMLYDNAQLLCLYAQAYQMTKNSRYQEILIQTGGFILQEMAHPEGGFFSAQDADSEGIEGKYYVWRKEEMDAALGTDADLFSALYGITEAGNWKDPHHDTRGLNILHLAKTQEAVATEGNIPLTDLQNRIASAKNKLLALRAKRIKPGLDDKVLMSWNGLMISGLAIAGKAIGEQKFIAAANSAAEFMVNNLYKNNVWLRSWRDGKAKGEALLEDYSYFIAGLLDLYEATFNAKWLKLAHTLAENAVNLFYDSSSGGFFMTPAGRPDLISRNKDFDDGAMPSASSIMALNCLRIADIFSEGRFREYGESTIKAHALLIREHPMLVPNLLSAADFALGPTRQVVLAGKTDEMHAWLNSCYLPRTSVVHASFTDTPLTQGKIAIQGKPTAYVCENSSCQNPVTSLEELEKFFIPQRVQNHPQ